MATTYIVLQEHSTSAGTDTYLIILGTADADTPRQAIRAFAPEDDDADFVTVPFRNWTEEATEVVTEVKFRSREFTDRNLRHVPEPPPEGQTTIEEAELAEIIGEPPAPEPEDDTTEDDPAEQDGPTDPEEFGPEEETPFDPSDLGGKAA